MKKSGFTVLELVVIVGIIALLAAVIFPLVLQYADSGRNTEAMASAKVARTSLQAALIDTDKFEDMNVPPRTIKEHIELADDEMKVFFESLDQYLPNGFDDKLGFKIEGGYIAEVLIETDKLLCVFDITDNYTITHHDSEEVLFFNSNQEFIAEGIEEGDLP